MTTYSPYLPDRALGRLDGRRVARSSAAPGQRRRPPFLPPLPLRGRGGGRRGLDAGAAREPDRRRCERAGAARCCAAPGRAPAGDDVVVVVVDVVGAGVAAAAAGWRRRARRTPD